MVHPLHTQDMIASLILQLETSTCSNKHLIAQDFALFCRTFSNCGKVASGRFVGRDISHTEAAAAATTAGLSSMSHAIIVLTPLSHMDAKRIVRVRVSPLAACFRQAPLILLFP